MTRMWFIVLSYKRYCLLNTEVCDKYNGIINILNLVGTGLGNEVT